MTKINLPGRLQGRNAARSAHPQPDDRLEPGIHRTADHRAHPIRYVVGLPARASHTSAAGTRARNRVTAA